MPSIMYTLLLLLLTSSLVKGSNYWPEQVLYDQHSRTPNPFNAAATANNEKQAQDAFQRFIVGPHTLPPNVIKITERIAVKIPYAQFIPVPHNVPYPFAVPVSRPVPIEVPKIINLAQDTQTEIPPNLSDLIRAYDEPVKTFNDAQIPSAPSNWPAEISQQLQPPFWIPFNESIEIE